MRTAGKILQTANERRGNDLTCSIELYAPFAAVRTPAGQRARPQRCCLRSSPFMWIFRGGNPAADVLSDKLPGPRRVDMKRVASARVHEVGYGLANETSATIIQRRARIIFARREIAKLKALRAQEKPQRQSSLPREARGIQVVQGGCRGALARKAISEGAEALEVHLDVLNSVEAARKQAGHNTFDDLESLIGSDDRRGYLDELETKKKLLLKRIEETRASRYYLSSAEQRAATKEIALMQEQLASTVHELVLVKHGNADDRKVDAATADLMRKHKARESKEKAKNKKPDTAVDEQMKETVWAFLRGCTQRQTEDLRRPADSMRRSVKALKSAVQVRLIPQEPSGEVRASIVSVMEEHRKAYRREEDKKESVHRTEVASMAKMHPQGCEAAIRKALLQTEIWTPSVRESNRHCRQLHKDLEHIDLQCKLTMRAKQRVAQGIEAAQAPQTMSRKPIKPKQQKAELEQLYERDALLGRYKTMLVATRDILVQEVKHTRRNVMKTALRKKREAMALAETRRNAAELIQMMWRSRMARQQRFAMVEAVRQEGIRIKRAEHKKKQLHQWDVATGTLTAVERAQQRARAAVKLQQTMRERQWQREEEELARRALERTRVQQRQAANMLSTMRFGPQRARLIARESAHCTTVKATRARQRRVVETQEESEEREALVQNYIHRAAHAAQQDARSTQDIFHAPEMRPSSPYGSDRPATAQHGRRAPPKSEGSSDYRPTTAPTRRSPPMARPVSVRHEPRPPPTARPSRAASARRSQQDCVPRPRTNIDAVTDVALGRKHWVKTPSNRSILDNAAAKALAPCLDRMSAQAVGSGAKAAVLLARRACENPPSRVPELEHLERQAIFANPRLNRTPDSATARIAAVWDDSRFHTANVKERSAMLRTWRSHTHAWVRSTGVRRQVLVKEEGRRTAMADRKQREVSALFTRMRQWQREDDAVLLIQAAWYAMKLRRREMKQMFIALQMRNQQHASSGGPALLEAMAEEKLARSLKEKLLERNQPAVALVPVAPAEDFISVDINLYEVTNEIIDHRSLSTVVEDISSCLDDLLTSLRTPPELVSPLPPGVAPVMAPLA